jgi:hypothetical protein
LVVWSLFFDVAISKACCHFLEIYSSLLRKNNGGEKSSVFIFENHYQNTWATLANFILFFVLPNFFRKKNILCHKFNQKIIKAIKLEPTSCPNKIIYKL